MIIAFTIIALIVISGLGMSIYAIFIPFLQNLSTMQSYNSAYYGAIAASERGLLVARQQGFGFDGSGGRQGNNNRGPISDTKTSDMEVLAEQDNGIMRSIQGSTNRIPQVGQGNIPTMLAASDSEDFNTFSTTHNTIIKLKTNTNADPETFYNAASRIAEKFTGNSIQTHWRVPEQIKGYLGGANNTLLCDTDTKSVCDINQDGISDDSIMTRQRQGNIHGEDFTIVPVTQTSENNGSIQPVTLGDSHIRESVINDESLLPTIPIIDFATTFQPIKKYALTSTITDHNTVGPGGQQIQASTFSAILNDPAVTGLALRYDMINKPINRDGYIYPFLEGYISADENFSDTDRHITGQGRDGLYNISIYIQKPQYNNNQGGNFTIVF